MDMKGLLGFVETLRVYVVGFSRCPCSFSKFLRWRFVLQRWPLEGAFAPFNPLLLDSPMGVCLQDSAQAWPQPPTYNNGDPISDCCRLGAVAKHKL